MPAARPLPPPPRATGGAGRGLVWLLAVVAVLVVVTVAVVLLVRDRAPALTESEAREAYDTLVEAVEDRDCALYESLTTADFRDEVDDLGYQCDAWEEAETGSATWSDLELDDEIEIDGDTATLVVEGTVVVEYAEDDFIDTERFRAAFQVRRVDGEPRFAQGRLDELDE
ncbi:MAG: hypothetical protein QM621_03385 [Aeromicrobium sp.]|uniref:Rv0361 family membrane protein n=1 Tax=Aeromicrobium sp. TaxID=1871063 RepID=UPI0039E50732